MAQIATYFHYRVYCVMILIIWYWYYLGYLILNLGNMINEFKYIVIVILHFN